MPMENKVSVILTDAQLAEIKKTIATLTEQMSFMVPLTIEQRRSNIKMGDKSLGFVETALEVLRQNPEAFPPNLSADELEKDLILYTQLKGVALSMAKITQALDDTVMVAGGEAYEASLLVYRLLKAMGDPNFKAALEELSKRFKQSSSSAAEPETSAPANEE